jgi:hypothetical protein
MRLEMADVVQLPIPASQDSNANDADERGRAHTQRLQRLYAWADAVLARIGLDRIIAAAKSLEDLRGITFSADTAEVILEIRDALHPVSGRREEYFRGLNEGSLVRILKSRFSELEKAREATLRRGRKRQTDWTDQLILNKDGEIVANLANLILILREAPKWRGVLGYDEFGARVVIRKSPPWGGRVAPHALDRSPRVSGARMVSKSEDQPGCWRRWTRRASSGSSQPISSGARLFRFAHLGRYAAT